MGNYQVIEQIGETAGGTLYLARHVQDDSNALLKLPALGSTADGLLHEYALLQSVDVPEILKPVALLEEGARLASVLEPFVGEGLEVILARQPRFALPMVLAIARQLARALGHSMRPVSCITTSGLPTFWWRATVSKSNWQT
jgi:serine/threonine protein kinase